MILLYAVVPADDRAVAAAEGLDVTVLVKDGVALVYREVDAVPRAEREEVLRFGDVLTGLAQATTMLPVRFGTVLPGVEQALEVLQSRGPGWRSRLDDVAGHVELIVHVGADVAPTQATGPGTGGDYLRAKVAEHRRRSTEVAEVTSLVEPWCRAARPLSSSAGLRLACLVPTDGVAELRSAVQTWAADHPDRPVAVTGPFPVFSFTEDNVA